MLVSVVVNTILLFLTIGAFILCAWFLKLRKQSLLLFILYGIFWISPLMCRDYSGLMHVHMDDKTTELLLFVPIMANGLIGIFWKPLNDFMSFKIKSRKSMLFIAIACQIATTIPFIVIPNFATNVIQSVGTGIGVSVMGLFILMLQGNAPNRKIFSTVNILVLPPIFAQIIASAQISIVTGLLSSASKGYEYIDTMWWLWVDALVFITVALILTIFIKEDRSKVVQLVSNNKIKMTTSPQKATFWICCIIATLILFIKWSTMGPIGSVQVAYLSMRTGVDTRGFEGYSGVIYAIGQFIGASITMLCINKFKRKNIVKASMMALALSSSVTYLLITSAFNNIPVYIGSNALNGLSYGVVYPVLVATVSNFYFERNKSITPLAVYNTCMSIGLTLGAFFTSYYKADVFLDIARTRVAWKYPFSYFVDANKFVNLICLCFALLAAVLYSINLILETKYWKDYYIRIPNKR